MSMRLQRLEKTPDLQCPAPGLLIKPFEAAFGTHRHLIHLVYPELSAESRWAILICGM